MLRGPYPRPHILGERLRSRDRHSYSSSHLRIHREVSIAVYPPDARRIVAERPTTLDTYSVDRPRSRSRERESLVQVNLQEGESQESLLGRFQKRMQTSGILREFRARRHFISNHEKERIAARKAARKAARRRQKAERGFARSR